MRTGAKGATSVRWSVRMDLPDRKESQPEQAGHLVPELDRPERCANCRLQHLYGRTLCGVCQMICPDQAIRWEEEAEHGPRKVAVEY